MGTSKNPHFIPTDVTAGETTSHPTKEPRNNNLNILAALVGALLRCRSLAGNSHAARPAPCIASHQHTHNCPSYYFSAPNQAKNAWQVVGYSHSTKPPRNGVQAAGYAALRKKFSFGQPEGYPTLKLRFLAGISTICGAAKFFAGIRYAACLLTPLPCLADDPARAAFARSGSASPCGAFGRTLNF